MGLQVERVDFVSVPVRDLARARRFYGEVLGLPHGGPAPDEFLAGGLTLALWRRRTTARPSRRTRPASGCAWRTSTTARAELESAGVPFVGETVDTGVCHMAFFHDSEGNVLILHRRYAPG